MSLIDQTKKQRQEVKAHYSAAEKHLNAFHAFVTVGKLRMFIVFGIVAVIAFTTGMKYGESKNPANSPDFTTQSIDSNDSSSYTIKELPESNYTVYLTKEQNNKPAIGASDIDCPGAKDGELVVQSHHQLPPLIKSKANSSEVNFFGFLLDMVAVKPQTFNLVRASKKAGSDKGQCLYLSSNKDLYLFSVSLKSGCEVRGDKKGFSCQE